MSAGSGRDASPASPASPATAGSRAFAEDLAFASAIARAAGAIVMDRYERLEAIEHKSAKDVVTEADHLAEASLISAIRARNASDAIYAEESGADSAGATSGSGRVWILDPLDGTVNYANGIPFFCVSVALVVDGRPAVGAVYDPTRDELFAAAADGPATLNGRTIVAGRKEGLADAVISLGLAGRNGPARSRAVRREVRVTRSMGSSALSLAYVANGRFDAFAQETGQSAWDVAAAGLIAARGGAIVTDFAGADWFEIGRKGGTWGIVGAAPKVHGPLFALIGTPPAR